MITKDGDGGLKQKTKEIKMNQITGIVEQFIASQAQFNIILWKSSISN